MDGLDVSPPDRESMRKGGKQRRHKERHEERERDIDKGMKKERKKERKKDINDVSERINEI